MRSLVRSAHRRNGTHRRSKRSAQKLQRKSLLRGACGCGCAGASPALSCILLCASMLYLRRRRSPSARRRPGAGGSAAQLPLGEALPADAALVALLARVDALVALEVAARHQRQPAHVAGVRLHARVRQLVHFERRRVDERLAAQVALQQSSVFRERANTAHSKLNRTNSPYIPATVHSRCSVHRYGRTVGTTGIKGIHHTANV